jgi:hypothetical protein
MLAEDEINDNYFDEVTTKMNDNRNLISTSTAATFATAAQRKPQHKIFPEHRAPKNCDNLTFIDCNYYLNDNLNAQRDRSPIKLVNSQKNYVEQNSSENQIYSIYNNNNNSPQQSTISSSPLISSTYNHHHHHPHNENQLRTSITNATMTANILCKNCFEIEQRKFDGNSPIFTIESTMDTIIDKNNHKQDSDVCDNGNHNLLVDNNISAKMRATISEESLSECSLSESLSCDCKLKSITIQLAKS